MSSSTSNLDLLTQSQYGHYITVNGLADAASPAMLFGRRQALCSGLNWFYYGGVLLADGVTTTVANNAAALVLTASSTNYIESTTAGVVSANTVGFTAGRIPLYTVVTGASSVTSYTDQRPLTYQSATFTANIKTFLTTPSSANLAAAVTDETGSGALVFATSPTLTTPTINTAASVGGTWTAVATWTLPAHTLGGTVSGGGNQLNNVVIGTVTPLAGAFTTLAASGQVTLSNASDYNLYASGAGANYMAGSLGVGSTSSLSTIKLRVQRSVSDSAITSYVGYFDGTHTLTANNTFRHSGITSAPTVNQGAFNATASIANGGSLVGLVGAPTVSGASGTVTCAAGVVADVRNTGAGTLTNAVGFLSATYANSGGGTLTNVYGFHAADTSAATNNYGFFGNLAAGAGKYNCYMDGTAPNYFAGDMQFGKTVTAGGTTTPQTINKNAGAVNFAAADASKVVTNSLVTASSIIVATVATNDSTMKSVQAVAAAGSFTLYANAAPTAETRVNFLVIN
ncbi:MAG: hypothetical protein ABTS22_20055 [Accumulibacter sp.]|uniref:hypothetical protein n=1 Tax=Accumulibacter sp. TaxID=2053492 RepID=UPI00331540E9